MMALIPVCSPGTPKFPATSFATVRVVCTPLTMLEYDCLGRLLELVGAFGDNCDIAEWGFVGARRSVCGLAYSLTLTGCHGASTCPRRLLQHKVESVRHVGAGEG